MTSLWNTPASHFCVAIEVVRKAAVVAITVRVSGFHGLRLHGFKKVTVDRCAPFALQELLGIVDGRVLGRGILVLAEVEDCQEQVRVDSKLSACDVDVVESVAKPPMPQIWSRERIFESTR